MKLFPHTVLVIHSRLSFEEVEKLLGTRIEPVKFLRFSGGGSRFQGSLQSDEFTMTRIIGYRNSFLPKIKGKITRSSPGTRIDLTLSLHPWVAIFMLLWFGGVVFFAAGASIGSVMGKNIHPVALIAPLGMAACGIAMASGRFWFEVYKQKPMLLGIFQGELITNPHVQ